MQCENKEVRIDVNDSVNSSWSTNSEQNAAILAAPLTPQVNFANTLEKYRPAFSVIPTHPASQVFF